MVSLSKEGGSDKLRTWFAAAVLLLLPLICLWTGGATCRCVDELAASLKETASAAKADDFSRAAEAAESAKKQWVSHADLLGALLRHDEADGVESGLAALVQFAETGDKDELLARCAELMQQIEHIRQMELPLLKNIL